MAQEKNNVIRCYDRTAENYAGKFLGEFSHKHLDRMLLKAFAEENKERGRLIDLGCGPGQTMSFLSRCGLTDIIGTDLSPVMIEVAKSHNPQLSFETADMLSLHYSDHSFGSAVAFYSIVHFNYDEIKTTFNEINRVLINGGQFLFSFHIGDRIVHLDNFLDQEVNIDFYFFEVEKIIGLLKETGFEIIDILERHPYEDIEYPSQRAYVWVKKTV